MHLLSWHGTVICLPDADGLITHQRLPLAGDAPGAMTFDAERLAERGTLQHPELGQLRVEPAYISGCVHLSRDGRYLCASDSIPLMEYDRTGAGPWEAWLPVSEQDMADLEHILRHRWIVRETRQVIRRTDIGFAAEFRLRIGSYIVALTEGLARVIAGRGGAGLPAQLLIADEAGQTELMIAEPRSSALLDTALWPVRARRTAEIVTLAAHRFMTGQEPTQETFERETAAVLADRGAAGLADLLERLEQPATPAAGDGRDDVLMAWALREMLPWLARPTPLDSVADDLNATEDWAVVYRFADGDVTIVPKPEAVGLPDSGQERADRYLALFKAAAGLLPPDYAATMCLCIADAPSADYGVPVFCLQKKLGETSILLPDIDFLLSDFHRGEEVIDTLSYEMKTPTAVFSGSTTGGTITPDVARTYGLPRLRAAKYFAGSGVVDFRLPTITQCSSEEAEAILKENVFCRLPDLAWNQQLKHRFVISMDGNGAAFSRVALALHSNSVLMKYNSDNQLFYFGGLQPWLNYVPVATDRDVEPILALEAAMPDIFKRIAENGSTFARTYLTEESLQQYTAFLLLLYARAISEAPQSVPVAGLQTPTGAGEAAPTVLVGHIQDRGDVDVRIGNWLGDVGSGRALEGFFIALAETLPAEGFLYQSVLEDGTLSEPVRSGEFCGTRGVSTPIFGFRIVTDGSFAELYDVSCQASFLDGSQTGPVAAGFVCRAATNAALEAMRVEITRRVPEDGQLEPAAGAFAGIADASAQDVYLLTWHGTCMCRANGYGRLRHEALPLPPGAVPLNLRLSTPATNIVRELADQGVVRAMEGAQGRMLTLQRDGFFMSAEGAPDQLPFNRTDAGAWEHFLPVSREELEDLQEILGCTWIAAETREVIRRDTVALQDGFSLQIGRIRLDLNTLAGSIVTERDAENRPVRLAVPDGDVTVDMVRGEVGDSALLLPEAAQAPAMRVPRIPGPDMMSPLAIAVEQFADARPLGADGSSDLPQGALLDAANDGLRVFASEMRLKTAFTFGLYGRDEIAIDTYPEAMLLNMTEGGVQVRQVADSPLYWQLMRNALPLLYLLDRVRASGRATTATFLAEVGDGGCLPGVAYSSQLRTGCLVPDPDFMCSGGYVGVRWLVRTQGVPWPERIGRVFWRGATTGSFSMAPPADASADDFSWLPRLDLCRRARDSAVADYFDVGISKIVQIDEPDLVNRIEQSGLIKPAVQRKIFLRHKAIIVIDGNSTAWSAMFSALLSGACVLLVASRNNHRQWYYDQLLPWKHYVPVRADLEDLDLATRWIMENDEDARMIGEAGQEFANAMTFEAASQDAVARLGAWIGTVSVLRES